MIESMEYLSQFGTTSSCPINLAVSSKYHDSILRPAAMRCVSTQAKRDRPGPTEGWRFKVLPPKRAAAPGHPWRGRRD
jgi:hypothetical protein